MASANPLLGLFAKSPLSPIQQHMNVVFDGTILLFMATTFGVFMAWGVGANDVANAIGPLAAVVSIVAHHGEIASKSALPLWILFLGGSELLLGLQPMVTK